MNPRQRQLSLYYNNQAVIAQDQELIDFCINRNVTQLCLQGDPDRNYFAARIPGCKVQWTPFSTGEFMLARLCSAPYVVFEQLIQQIEQQVAKHNPAWVYIAVNKYAVTTDKTWTNLTDDYDNDLLNIIAKSLPHYTELKRHSCFDRGQYFNFVHPSTYVYFERG